MATDVVYDPTDDDDVGYFGLLLNSSGLYGYLTADHG